MRRTHCTPAVARLRGYRTILAAGLALVAPAHAQQMQFYHAELVRALLPTVVNITARAEVAAPEPAPAMAGSIPSERFEIRTSVGSGYVIDPAGTIGTSWHVVAGAYEIIVTFADGSRTEAEVANAARIPDVAILKVHVGHPLTAVRWGDSSKLQIGEPVLAMGDPLGVGLSVTAGIVSGLNRNILNTPFEDFIQTDAPINHGNSGGPLFNLAGELIGMNTALVSPTTASAGVGFALPSNDLHFVVDRLQQYGWVAPGWMGVKIQPVTPEIALGLGLTEPQDVIVNEVTSGGPGAAAGLQVGDVLTRFDDEVPSDDRAWQREIGRSSPGRVVKIGLWRDGQALVLPVTLAEWPKTEWEEYNAPTKATKPHWSTRHDLGLLVKPLTIELRAKNELPSNSKGVFVSGVVAESEAARSGVKPGDLVIQVGQHLVATSQDMQREIDRARAGNREVALFLILPRNAEDVFPGPKWYALRVLP